MMVKFVMIMVILSCDDDKKDLYRRWAFGGVEEALQEGDWNNKSRRMIVMMMEILMMMMMMMMMMMVMMMMMTMTRWWYWYSDIVGQMHYDVSDRFNFRCSPQSGLEQTFAKISQ